MYKPNTPSKKELKEFRKMKKQSDLEGVMKMVKKYPELINLNSLMAKRYPGESEPD